MHTSQDERERQLGLGDIALLARVQRPVPSTWRTRSVDPDLLFPPPVARVGREEGFSLDSVVDWLEATGRGRNPGAFPGAEEAAALELAARPETALHLQRVLELIEGFETPYGLELLATVHWVVHHGVGGDDGDVVEAVRAWSPRKGQMFTPDHVLTALGVLRDRGWTPVLTAAR